MSEDGLSEPCDEPSMELYVESLTGTSFEMRVYPTDTVLDIKNKIFRVEGIPVPQQNLLFQMKELNDHSRLSDLGIVNGSTLRLVTAMRGGPISTRRWTSDHMVWKDLKDLIEHTREELGDKLGTKVSVLVFKEGEVIKWLRVIENEDGSYSPYTEQRAIAPPCSGGGGSGGGGGGCGVGSGAGSTVGSRSGSKHYQHHKASATVSSNADAATMSSNTIDFQELMQFKQHASALSSYYHQQHHHRHHNHPHHHTTGSSTVTSNSSVGEHHHHQLQQHLQQQQQHQRQQVYRRLEDDVRMKGRVNMLKSRMQRARRCKGKAIVSPSEVGDNNGDLRVTEEIAIGRSNDNLVLTAVLSDELIDDDEEGIDEAFKPDLRLEALLRTLQNSESLVGVNGNGTERYTLAQRYHRRTHSRNSNNDMLQLDTSHLPDDNLTLLKPIPSSHGTSKHNTESGAAYLVGTNTTASTASKPSTSTTTTNNNNNSLSLLLMDCGAASAATTVTGNSGNSGGNESTNSSSANDLEVALKEKHRSSRLRLHAAAAAGVVTSGAGSNNEDSVEAIGKCMKNAIIGRRLSNNSVNPTCTNSPINITTANTLQQPPSVSMNNATGANGNNYVCTNLHVFEPQHNIIAPGIRHDISPKRRGGGVGKGTATTGALLPSTGSVASAAGDFTRERLSLPDTKRRAKIGRLLNTTITPGSGETSDSDDGGLWSWQATVDAATRLRHCRPTTKRLVLPDTTSGDKVKCGMDGVHSIPLDDDLQHVILPDIWEHHGTLAAPTSPTNSIVGGGGAGSLVCARAAANASPNAADALIASARDIADAVEDSNSAAAHAAAACIRDYMDLDSEFDKMFSELRSAVPIPSIPSAIPPQYAPKDCQLYLGSPVVPLPTQAPSPASEATSVNSNKSAAMATATATLHRLSPLGTLPYHVHGLCTSPTAGTTTRRSPLYHRRTAASTATPTVVPNVQSVTACSAAVGPTTTDDDRTTIAAAARSVLEKVQRTAAAEIGNVANSVNDKTVRQRRRRYSTDDCEFTLERLQNDYVPDGFDYSDFDSYTADVDDMIGRYGQEAIVNARWMEAAAAAAAAALSSSRSSSMSPPQQLPPTARHRNTMRLRTTTTPTDAHHMCLAEQIQRLGLGLDTDTDTEVGLASTHLTAGVPTSPTNALGTRIGTTFGPSHRTPDRNANTTSMGKIAHSNILSTGLDTDCCNSDNSSNNNTKLPALVEHGKAQRTARGPLPPLHAAAAATPGTSRGPAPRMRCAHCNRKLNITNIYDCRCGRIFCAQHRYSEVHECAHDYKTEGRRLLAQQNPLVTAPKLAKF